MAARKRRRSVTLSMEAIEIRKLMLIKETNELLAQVIDNQRQLGAVNAPIVRHPQDLDQRFVPMPQLPHQPDQLAQWPPPKTDTTPDMPRVTTSPTGCQICGNPYAVFTEVRPGLSQYLCQIHARERNLQKAADAKVAAAGFSVDKTDARPQNIRLPEDNQRAKVLIHPTAADEMAVRQHATDHPDVPDHVEFNEADDETA